MCEVTPYMVSVATRHGISVIYHSVALLISTTGVVYNIKLYMLEKSCDMKAFILQGRQGRLPWLPSD